MPGDNGAAQDRTAAAPDGPQAGPVRESRVHPIAEAVLYDLQARSLSLISLGRT